MAEKYNICLDVGGTKVLGAIFNEKDEIIFRLKKRSKSGGSASEDVEKVIIDVVEEMIKESGISRKKLNAVASCAPGVIDQEKGIVLFTPNLPWRDYDMASSMRKQFGVPFFVGNDVNLGVLGEYHFGAGRGYKNIVGFFVGTGMGGGLILNGSLYTGHQFKAAAQAVAQGETTAKFTISVMDIHGGTAVKIPWNVNIFLSIPAQPVPRGHAAQLQVSLPHGIRSRSRKQRVCVGRVDGVEQVHLRLDRHCANEGHDGEEHNGHPSGSISLLHNCCYLLSSIASSTRKVSEAQLMPPAEPGSSS